MHVAESVVFWGEENTFYNKERGSKMKKVMITGIGMLTAVGNGKAATWESVKAGKP